MQHTFGRDSPALLLLFATSKHSLLQTMQTSCYKPSSMSSASASFPSSICDEISFPAIAFQFPSQIMQIATATLRSPPWLSPLASLLKSPTAGPTRSKTQVARSHRHPCNATSSSTRSTSHRKAIVSGNSGIVAARHNRIPTRPNQMLQSSRNILACEWRSLASADMRLDVVQLEPEERQFSCQHLPHQNAKAVHIYKSAAASIQQQLRRHVRRRASCDVGRPVPQ